MRPTYVAMKYLRTPESSWNFAFHYCFHASHRFIGQWCVRGAGFCWIYSLLSQTLGACIQFSKKQPTIFFRHGVISGSWNRQGSAAIEDWILLLSGGLEDMEVLRVLRGRIFLRLSEVFHRGLVGWGRLEKLILNPGWRFVMDGKDCAQAAMPDSEAGNFVDHFFLD